MYRVSVKPRPQREADIKDLIATSSEEDLNHDVYEGQPLKLPVIVAPVGLPVYRMANGRTQTAQFQHIHKHDLAEDFFSSGEENQAAQQAQHSILAKLADEKRENIASILDELKRRRQTDPILITPFGQVVNGNRRLAAIRELSTQDSQAADAFRNVRCAVLPALNELQIDELEMRLQMSPETKLPYSWVNEALKVRRLIRLGQSEQEVARMMNRRATTVRRALEALTLADIYLNDWRQEPQEYQLVEDGRQFFNDLVQNLENKQGSLRETTMRLAFALFDGERKGRLYNLNPVLKDHAEELIEKVAEEIADHSPTGNVQKEIGADDLFISFDDPRNNGTTEVVNQFLANEPASAATSEIITAAARATLEKRSNVQAGRRALNVVKEARDDLKELDLSKADPSTYKQMMVILEDMIDRIHDMQKVIRDYRLNGS